MLGDIRSLLFDNRSVKQTIFKNTFWIAISSGISKILRTLLIIYTARILGAADYGKLNFALAFISVLVSLFDLGLSAIITREFSRNKEREKEFSSLLSFKILLGFISIILIGVSSFFITADHEIQKIIWILAFFSFITQFPETFYAFLRARQRMEYESWANVFQALLVAALGFFVLFHFPSLENISYSYLLAGLGSVIPFLIFFHFKVFPLKLSYETAIWKRFLSESWPLALISIFSLLYGYFDSIIMGYLGQLTQTGWYNAALKIISIILIPTGIIPLCFYPVLSKFSKESKEKFQKAYNAQTEIMISLAFPIVVGGWILAPKIIEFVYGQEYLRSILAFQILLIMAGLSFFLVCLSKILVAADQQKKMFFISVIGAMVNIILNLILIPRFSLNGAAVSSVITYFSTMLLSLYFTYKFTSINPINFRLFFSSLLAVFSTLIMCFAISGSAIYHLNVLILIMIGVITYSVAFFALRFTFKWLPIQKFYL